MAVTIYRSTDTSAPVLHGNAGSLISVLDACLVNGYGSQTALGWGKAFSGTNAASYRAAAGVRHYLDVNDNGPDGTALGRNARLRGYETMSAVATGTGLFPTTTQVTNCVYVKSTATGTTARPWILIGDDRTFYLFSAAGGTDPPNLSTNTWTDGFFFGEIFAGNTGDNYRTIIAFPSITSAAVASAFLGALPTVASNTAAINYAMARSYLGTGAAEWCVPVSNPFFQTGQLYTIQSGIAFPNTSDGGIYLNAFAIGGKGAGTTPTATSYIRGRLRGLYGTAHYITAMNDQDTFSGVADFAGRTFIVLHCAGVRGQGIVLETTPWAASV